MRDMYGVSDGAELVYKSELVFIEELPGWPVWRWRMRTVTGKVLALVEVERSRDTEHGDSFEYVAVVRLADPAKVRYALGSEYVREALSLMVEFVQGEIVEFGDDDCFCALVCDAEWFYMSWGTFLGHSKFE